MSSFMIKNDSLLIEYNEIWNKVKKTLNIKFYSMPADDEKYIKFKVKEFNGIVNTVFSDDILPKEGVCITLV